VNLPTQRRKFFAALRCGVNRSASVAPAECVNHAYCVSHSASVNRKVSVVHSGVRESILGRISHSMREPAGKDNPQRARGSKLLRDPANGRESYLVRRPDDLREPQR